MATAAAKQSSAPASVPQPIIVQQQPPLRIEYDRGSDDKPLIVTNRPTEEEKKSAVEKAQDDHNLTIATEVLAVLTLVLAVASVAAAVAAFLSSKQAAEAAKDLHKLERAYVFAKAFGRYPEVEKPNGLRTFRYRVRYFNHGKTPAVLKVLRQTIKFTDEMPTALPENPRANRVMPDGLVIGPGSSWSWPDQAEITNQEFGILMTNPDARCYIYGVLKYEDVMGNEHETGFCWYSEQQKKNGLVFLIADTGLNYRT